MSCSLVKTLTLGVGPGFVHVGRQILSNQHDDGMLCLELVYHLVTVVYVWRALSVSEILGRLVDRVFYHILNRMIFY